MRILLLCLWFSFGANNLFAINGQAQKLDSLNWSVSLLGGASNLSVKGFNSGEEKSTTGFGAIRITRKFESLIDLQLQVGLGSIRHQNRNRSRVETGFV